MPIPNILGANGVPLASAVCLARLKVVDPRLGVKYINGVLGGYWALTETWRDRDPRRARIASGEIRPDTDFDVKHLFKRDMPMESIAAYVEANWGPRNAPKDPVAEAARVAEAQQRVKDAKKEEKLEQFNEKQEYQVIHTTDHERRLLAKDTTETAHPMVHGFGEAANVGRGKKKIVAAPPAAPISPMEP